MTLRRPVDRDSDTENKRQRASVLYSPWDARVERNERRSLFWTVTPSRHRRAGLIGRLEYMTVAGTA